MRVFSQIVVVAVGAGLAVGGWYYWQGRADGKPAAASTARGQQVVAVDTVRAERGLVEERVESIGTARANEAIVLTAKITGHVSAIGFKEGQKVQAGRDEGLLPTSPESGTEVVRGLAEFLKLAGSIQAKHLNRTGGTAG